MKRSWMYPLVLAALAAALTSSAQAQCVGGGPAGAIPAQGNGGGGTFQSLFPPVPYVGTLAVTVPAGATVLKSVKLNGLNHTWSGDAHFILETPAGTLHNVLCAMPTDPGADYVNTNLEIVDPIRGQSCSSPAGSVPFNVNPVPSGTYIQGFDGWIDGNLGVGNTPLEQIPISSGNWKLYAYDWVGGDLGSIASWELCFGLPTPPPPPPPALNLNCVTGGAGGFFPNSGANGVWPTTLPTGELIAPLAVTVPAGATQIKALKVNALNHPWAGDIHLVLQSPSGTLYNVAQLNDNLDPNFDFVACNLTVVGATTVDGCGNPYPTIATTGAYGGSVTRRQTYGVWNSGDAGIFNTDLAAIPLASGTWNLIAYDWFPALDDGDFASWELCFDAPSGPVTYCTSGTSTNGCVPAISATGTPSVSASSGFVINVANVEGLKSGLIFYGVSGQAAAVWGAGSNSFLCVKAPTQRMTFQSSGGAAGLCNGALSEDWLAYAAAHPAALGQPFGSGNVIDAQAWYRDPQAVKTTNLSNGLEFVLVP